MTAEPALDAPSPDDDGRERRCLVQGKVRPEAELVRFVAGPGDVVVPDIAAKLPGRGMWVSADREALEKAAAKNLFSRAAKRPLKVPAGLADHVANLLVRRLADDLGLARKAGNLVLGFDKIVKAFESRQRPVLLIEALDGAADGRRKLLAVAAAQRVNPQVLACLTTEELSLALGRENVVHAALPSGPLAEKIAMNAGRLAAVRAHNADMMEHEAGPVPADERHE